MSSLTKEQFEQALEEAIVCGWFKQPLSIKQEPAEVLPTDPLQRAFVVDLNTVIRSIKALLIEKNAKYGDAVLSPNRVFSKASTTEQILVRMDDKISRIISGKTDDTEDVFKDLLGYLVIYHIAKLREARQLEYETFKT